MALNYQNMRKLAQKLIDDNGGPVTFFKKSNTPADATKPWKGSAGADIQVSVIGVVIPNMEDDDPQAMRRGKATAYIAAEEFTDGSPSFTELAAEGFETMTDSDGITWDVHGIDIIAPSGLRILYTCTLEH